MRQLAFLIVASLGVLSLGSGGSREEQIAPSCPDLCDQFPPPVVGAAEQVVPNCQGGCPDLPTPWKI